MKTKENRLWTSIVKLFAVAVMTVLCVGMGAFSVQASEGYSGTPVTPEQITVANYTDYGFTKDTYKLYLGYYGIRNAEELYGFAELVNNGAISANGVVTADIVVNTQVLDESGNLVRNNSLYDWNGIGEYVQKLHTYYYTTGYSGTFDGQGYTISGLYCNSNNADLENYYKNSYASGGLTEYGLESGLRAYSGLFCRNSGTVRNVRVVDSYFSDAEDCNWSSYATGAICGTNFGTIENCYSNVTIDNSTAGGICGMNGGQGIISHCTSESLVFGVEKNGGICGWDIEATIQYCHNNGEVISTKYAGGIVGYENGNNPGATIQYCYNTSEISASEGYAGGICGYNAGYNGVLDSCYNTGNILSGGEAGSICGYFYNTSYVTINDCYYLTGGVADAYVTAQNAAKTSAEFSSGAVCYLLNDCASAGNLVWYQTIGTDAYPTLDSSSQIVYASYEHNATAADYINDESLKAHSSPNNNGSHDKLLDFVDNGDGTFTRTCSACGYTMSGLMINGLHQAENGNYYYYVYGEVDTSMDGLCQITFDDGSSNWFYFENGRWILDKYSFVEYGGGMFLVANGTLANLTGLQQYNGDWYYLSNGQLHTSYTGMALYDGEWFYVDGGILDTNYNGIQNYDGSKFLIAAGRLLLSYSGLFENTDGTWYYIASGQVQTDYTGLAEYNGAWFYIQKGVFKTNYTGYVWYNGTRFYVYKGSAVL